ncbi:MAG: DUF2069 domain-containing protein [Chiayiivirga sp.]|uniref:DUF2069 domain-containing protein n=1 Tax=Chiayiivirga sp. TaxID=2041042 RepID=UPI0025BB1501|nr:DUF2069 domain-containing protein [Chiayiivirga sp.]MCI1710435.1 DUF2069 domain-containing protein [Chiayiivirga sp.]MCI1730831.1 DUF2069 domain-containing protein [Chiayiivirga sp.]
MNAPARARSLARFGLVVLVGLILAWHGWLAPPADVPVAFALGLHLMPLLPALWLLLRNDRRSTFFGALGALILFCHGVSEAWASPATRVLASSEVALCLVVIGGASWDGLRARFAKSRGV